MFSFSANPPGRLFGWGFRRFGAFKSCHVLESIQPFGLAIAGSVCFSIPRPRGLKKTPHLLTARGEGYSCYCARKPVFMRLGITLPMVTMRL
jgi:hypothetical protein